LKQLETEPPHRLALRREEAAAVFGVEYRLESTETETRLTQVSEVAWKSLPRALRGTFGSAVRREVIRQLRRLTTLLERDGPLPDSSTTSTLEPRSWFSPFQSWAASRAALSSGGFERLRCPGLRDRSAPGLRSDT
jgi:hypothetical protein